MTDRRELRLVACVKAVPASTEVKMDPKTNTIVRDGGDSVVNPFDATALEVALELRDRVRARGRAARVSVLSMGIPATEALLRDCIARGADRALLLSDRAFAGADTLATTHALTCGINKLGGADVIFCGKMAVDGDTAQIGPELAGALNMTCATDVREVAGLDEAPFTPGPAATGELTVRCQTDEGLATVELPLPAVITLAKETAQLRMPSITGVLAAEGAEVCVMGAADAGADPGEIGLSGSPTQVLRSFVPERSQGGVEVVGTAAEQARQIVDAIEGMA